MKYKLKKLVDGGIPPLYSNVSESTNNSLKSNSKIQNFKNNQDSDTEKLSDNEFEKKYNGLSKHEYLYKTNENYKNKYNELAQKSTNNIDYPSDDYRNPNFISPNNQFMYPQLDIKGQKQQTDITNNIIQSVLPIPISEELAPEKLLKSAANRVMHTTNTARTGELIDNFTNKYLRVDPEVLKDAYTAGFSLPRKIKPTFPEGYSLTPDESGSRYWLNNNNKQVGQVEYMSPTVDTQGRNWGSINIEIDPRHRGKGLSAPMYQQMLDHAEQQGHHGIMSMDNSLQSPMQSKAIRKYFNGKYSEDPSLLKHANDVIDEDNKFIQKDNILWGDNEPMRPYESNVYLMSNKNKFKQGGIIKDDRGQWTHPGKITEIGSNRITMQGVPYPVLGISDTGHQQVMHPGQDYIFDGNSVVEYPLMNRGGTTWLNKYQNGGWRIPKPNIEYNGTEGSFYNPLTKTITSDPTDPKIALDHELFHYYQDLMGKSHIGGQPYKRPSIISSDSNAMDFFNTEEVDMNKTRKKFINKNPSFQFIPKQVLDNGIDNGDNYIPGATEMMYRDPSTLEGGARQYEQYIQSGGEPLFKKGGFYKLKKYASGGTAQTKFVSDLNDKSLRDYTDSLNLYNKSNKLPEGVFENSKMHTEPYDEYKWETLEDGLLSYFPYPQKQKHLSYQDIQNNFGKNNQNIPTPKNISFYVNPDGTFTPVPEYEKPHTIVAFKSNQDFQQQKNIQKQQELVKAGLLQPNDVNGVWGKYSSDAWDKYINFPTYNNGKEELKQYYNIDKNTGNKKDSIRYLAGLQLLKQNGEPNIDFNTKNLTKERPVGFKSNYNVNRNTINLEPKDKKALLAELAHSKQYVIDNFDNNNPVQLKLEKQYSDIYKTEGPQAAQDFHDKTYYSTPGTDEYNAHKEIQPLLEKQYADYYNELYKNNILNKYQPKVTTTPVDENTGNPKFGDGGTNGVSNIILKANQQIQDQLEYFDKINTLKQRIKNAETFSSKDPYKAINNTTGALGAYQFIPRFNKDLVDSYPNLQDFMNNPQAQEGYMDKKIPEYFTTAFKLKEKYPDETKDLSPDDLVVLTHFKGPRGLERDIKQGNLNKSSSINPSDTSYLERTKGNYKKELGGTINNNMKKVKKYRIGGTPGISDDISGNGSYTPQEQSNQQPQWRFDQHPVQKISSYLDNNSNQNPNPIQFQNPSTWNIQNEDQNNNNTHNNNLIGAKFDNSSWDNTQSNLGHIMKGNTFQKAVGVVDAAVDVAKLLPFGNSYENANNRWINGQDNPMNTITRNPNTSQQDLYGMKSFDLGGSYQTDDLNLTPQNIINSMDNTKRYSLYNNGGMFSGQEVRSIYEDGGQQSNPQQQLMQLVAQDIQQGMQPQQILQLLVSKGVPQQQAQQLIQVVMQQLQRQQQPQMQGTPQQMNGQEEQQEPQQNQQEESQEQPQGRKGGRFMGINPAHKGYCTPMTKSTCTPRRKALALTLKKHHGFHKNGGFTLGQTYDLSPAEIAYLKNLGYQIEKQ